MKYRKEIETILRGVIMLANDNFKMGNNKIIKDEIIKDGTNDIIDVFNRENELLKDIKQYIQGVNNERKQ